MIGAKNVFIQGLMSFYSRFVADILCLMNLLRCGAFCLQTSYDFFVVFEKRINSTCSNAFASRYFSSQMLMHPVASLTDANVGANVILVLQNTSFKVLRLSYYTYPSVSGGVVCY